jgi:hypothetical protein
VEGLSSVFSAALPLNIVQSPWGDQFVDILPGTVRLTMAGVVRLIGSALCVIF